jgi:hypothetical protein
MKKMRAAIAAAPMTAPIPIPAFAPVDSPPLAETGKGVEVPDPLPFADAAVPVEVFVVVEPPLVPVPELVTVNRIVLTTWTVVWALRNVVLVITLVTTFVTYAV